jgi:hypothetical protein
MKAKIFGLLSLSVLLLGTAGHAISPYPTPPAHFASSFGSPRRISAGQIYKSPKHLFTIVAPYCNPRAFGPGWDVLYESEKDTHEMVTLSMPLAVQTYRAGIVETSGPNIDLNVVAHAIAVSRKHQIGVPFDLVEESKISTKFGEGSLRVYSIKGGSLDKWAPLGPKPQYQYRDAYVAVLLVPQEKRILFAVSQDDNFSPLDKNVDESWKKTLKEEAQAFFATMTLGE